MAADVVRRIFAEYLDENGDRAIAAGLNRDGVLCPSAHRPRQNTHRHADGWQGSTVRAILENPRYTGYAFFGRWTKHEVLLDPDDVAAGYVTRFRRSNAERVVRSRKPAHPDIVSVEMFVQAQIRRRLRAAGGMRGIAKLERQTTKVTGPYLLRGRFHCGLCERKMQGTTIRKNVYYRCTARTLAPGSAALAYHPKTVNVREDQVLGSLNDWIGSLFAPEHVDETVSRLLSSQDGATDGQRQWERLKARVTDAETRLRRHRVFAATECADDGVIEGADGLAMKEPHRRGAGGAGVFRVAA